jgi:hypothetical protein
VRWRQHSNADGLQERDRRLLCNYIACTARVSPQEVLSDTQGLGTASRPDCVNVNNARFPSLSLAAGTLPNIAHRASQHSSNIMHDVPDSGLFLRRAGCRELLLFGLRVCVELQCVLARGTQDPFRPVIPADSSCYGECLTLQACC